MKNILMLIVIAVILVLLQLCLGSQILLPFAGAFSLISVAVGVWLSLQQYSLKVKSENAEKDIELMTLFTKIMSTAHARSGYVSSEKAVEKLFDNNLFTEAELKDPKLLNLKIEEVAVITLPVGLAEQDAAIAAIAELGLRHESLRNIAIEGLESVSKFKPEITKKYLEKLKND